MNNRESDTLYILRALRDRLCPSGMVALQVGGIGDLPLTEDGESRIVIITDSMHQYVGLTDDEWEGGDELIDEIVGLIEGQREESDED